MKQFILITLVVLATIFCNRAPKDETNIKFKELLKSEDEVSIKFIELLKAEGIAIKRPADSMDCCFIVSNEVYKTQVSPLIRKHNLQKFVTYFPDRKSCGVCVFPKATCNK